MYPSNIVKVANNLLSYDDSLNKWFIPFVKLFFSLVLIMLDLLKRPLGMMCFWLKDIGNALLYDFTECIF